MKKALYVWITVIAVSVIMLVVLALTSSPAHAEDSDTPIVKTVYVDKIVYVDKPVTVYVDKSVARTVDVPVTKTVYVEVPVYEIMPVTSNPKTIRAMMKVTHDRYITLLSKYRELMKAKKK